MSVNSLLTPSGRVAHIPLEELALDIKRAVIKMADVAGGGYIGQGLGSAEMIAALFFRKLRLDPGNPNHPDRDRFLLSTGHYAISIYAAMAKLGLIEEYLLNHYSLDGTTLELIGSEVTPGLEIGGGSLGQGLSRGIGHALTAKRRKSSWKTYVYMSDGELQEGQVWEAAMVASYNKLDNLLLIIDYNGLQVEGNVHQVTNMEPVVDRWQSFGWNVIDIDGNDMTQVMHALDHVPQNQKPTVIISRTVIGNSISFLQGREDIHYIRWSKEETEKALSELGGSEA